MGEGRAKVPLLWAKRMTRSLASHHGRLEGLQIPALDGSRQLLQLPVFGFRLDRRFLKEHSKGRQVRQVSGITILTHQSPVFFSVSVQWVMHISQGLLSPLRL